MIYRTGSKEQHARGVAEPIDMQLAEVRRILHRRHQAHVGETLFKIFAERVRGMEPAAATMFLRDDLAVEAELRELEFAPNRVPGGRVAYASTATAEETKAIEEKFPYVGRLRHRVR